MNISFTYRPISLHTEHSKNSKFVGSLIALMLFIFVGSANAQTLVAVDDGFGIPSNVSSVEPLIVEDPGVLKNDTLDLGNIDDYVVTAELVSSVANGTLVCPVDGALELCADGSFQYWPGPGFDGSDSFTYQAIYLTTVSAPATVTLTACTEDAALLFSCWKESAYRSKLAELGYGTFEEGFEGPSWDGVRSPNKAPAITSQGITWTPNHPATNDITTGPGPARSGLWGAWESNHGSATGTSTQCDVDNPPEHCLYHDGLSGSIQAGGDPIHESLHGVGGYITGIYGAKIAIILDGTIQVDFGTVLGGVHDFVGVIDATTSGFTGFEFREMDGKIGQALFIWSDDFTIATSAACVEPNSHGTIAGADNAKVNVTCVTETFTIGGNVSGLEGTGLVLQNNLGEDLAISVNGGFAFATPLDDGSTYTVSVLTQPANLSQTCVVSNGGGTIAGQNVTDINVTCVTETFTIGGNVSGLEGTGLVLQNNLGDDLAISVNGGFAFATPLNDGSTYTVSIETQPTDLSQTCSVTNGSGTLTGANITNVSVTCATTTFQINAGLNDAWYYPVTDGQGFYITVFPDIGFVSLSWFTYDNVRPDEGVTANLGEPGHRWLNAIGPYSGNQAVVDISYATGGIFDSPTEVTEVSDGTIILTFTDCKNGTVEYDIPSINQQGIVPIERIVFDNVPLCETLAEQSETQQSIATQKEDKSNTLSSYTPATPSEGPQLTEMNAGLNDAWYYPVTDGQGFYITVFPDIGFVSLSWFTYDNVRPDEGVTANLGEPGHRWLNAFGPYSGNQAVMDISYATSGVFDSPTKVTEVSDGTIILTFTDCKNGTVEYDIPSINQQGMVPIERIVFDNVPLCETLSIQ